MINFVIEIILIGSIQKKKSKCIPIPSLISSIYTTCTIISVSVVYCLHGVKIQGLFQTKGPRKEKSMANNNNMYIIMSEIDDIHMLQLSTPNKIVS